MIQPRSATPRKVSAKLIGQRLLAANVITEVQLEAALALQGKKGGKLVEILVGMGCFTPSDFVTFLAKQPGVASISLAHYTTPKELISLIPREFAIEHEVFPIDKMGKHLSVGMVCPLDAQTIQKLETLTGLRVQALLCEPQDIKASIERYYTEPVDYHGLKPHTPDTRSEHIETSLRLASVAHMLRLIKKLPALPETVERFQEIMANPNEEISAIAAVISLDPPIAARVLGVVNSAAYGLPNRIDELKPAVSLLGLRETYSLVMSCAVVNVFEKSKNMDYRAFWIQSQTCASAARMIAGELGDAHRFGVFAAGLLCDLGRAALSEVVPQLYEKVDQKLPIPQLLAEEQQILGITHAEAGYQLAHDWGLPEEIVEPIRFHHAPELATAAKENVAIVALASAMARAMNADDEVLESFQGIETAGAILKLTPQRIDTIWQKFHGNFRG